MHINTQKQEYILNWFFNKKNRQWFYLMCTLILQSLPAKGKMQLWLWWLVSVALCVNQNLCCVCKRSCLFTPSTIHTVRLCALLHGRSCIIHFTIHSRATFGECCVSLGAMQHKYRIFISDILIQNDIFIASRPLLQCARISQEHNVCRKREKDRE